ncbi:MAG: diacylglyceryl transferase, partial [Cetobacterium sp.]
MLEELIERFIYNLKKFLGCVIGLVVAILLVEYGF